MTGHRFTRRDAIKLLGAGAGTAAAASLVSCSDEAEEAQLDPAATLAVQRPAPTVQTTPTPKGSDPSIATPASAAPQLESSTDRLLVVIELAGGMDGLSMVPPIGIGRYYDLRRATSIAPDRALRIDDEVGLHPNLRRLHQRRLAIVQGVGSFQPDESHFAMQHRWHTGDPNGTLSLETGIWGRIADALGDTASPAVAMSIGSGAHPGLRAARAQTLSISGPDQAQYLAGDPNGDALINAFRNGINGMYSDETFDDRDVTVSTGGISLLRHVGRQARDLAEQLQTLESDQASAALYPSTGIGQNLRFAARVLAGALGTRIVHVPMNEDFDTHQSHNVRFDILMTDLDEAVNAFLTDIEHRGMAERVVVAVVSEFGRRAGDNGQGGLDHGTANNLLACGAVIPGRFGEMPSFDTLVDGNFVSTMSFNDYYASLAGGWLGLDTAEIVGNARPIAGLFPA